LEKVGHKQVASTDNRVIVGNLLVIKKGVKKNLILFDDWQAEIEFECIIEEQLNNLLAVDVRWEVVSDFLKRSSKIKN
jgi:hypothetical protein